MGTKRGQQMARGWIRRRKLMFSIVVETRRTEGVTLMEEEAPRGTGTGTSGAPRKGSLLLGRRVHPTAQSDALLFLLLDRPWLETGWQIRLAADGGLCRGAWDHRRRCSGGCGGAHTVGETDHRLARRHKSSAQHS